MCFIFDYTLAGRRTYKNVKKAYFKIVKLLDINEMDIDRGLTKDQQKNLLSQSGEFNWSLDIPDDGDFYEHYLLILAWVVETFLKYTCLVGIISNRFWRSFMSTKTFCPSVRSPSG